MKTRFVFGTSPLTMDGQEKEDTSRPGADALEAVRRHRFAKDNLLQLSKERLDELQDVLDGVRWYGPNKPRKRLWKIKRLLCQRCQTPLSVRRRRFCSFACYRESMRSAPRKERPAPRLTDRPCRRCGRPLPETCTRYCSKACRVPPPVSLPPSAPKGRCRWCGEVLTDGRRRFCGKECCLALQNTQKSEERRKATKRPLLPLAEEIREDLAVWLRTWGESAMGNRTGLSINVLRGAVAKKTLQQKNRLRLEALYQRDWEEEG